MSKPGKFTYISISKIRCGGRFLTLVLVLVMDFFVALGAIALGFFFFNGGGMDS